MRPSTPSQRKGQSGINPLAREIIQRLKNKVVIHGINEHHEIERVGHFRSIPSNEINMATGRMYGRYGKL